MAGKRRVRLWLGAQCLAELYYKTEHQLASEGNDAVDFEQGRRESDFRGDLDASGLGADISFLHPKSVDMNDPKLIVIIK